GHLLDRLQRQIVLTGNPALTSLLAELEGYPGAPTGNAHQPATEIAVPLRLSTGDGELALLSMIATFGTAVEVTASELSIESFVPLDGATAAALHRRAAKD